jgi:hypothetical protein
MPDYTRDFKARKLTERPDMLERIARPVGKKFAKQNLKSAANNPTRRGADVAEGQEIADSVRGKRAKAKLKLY